MDFQGLSLTRTSGKMSFVPLPALMDKGNWPSLSVSDTVVQGLRNTLCQQVEEMIQLGKELGCGCGELSFPEVRP